MGNATTSMVGYDKVRKLLDLRQQYEASVVLDTIEHDDPSVRFSASYWLHRALVEIAFGRSDEAMRCLEEARQGTNWQTVMSADFYTAHGTYVAARKRLLPTRRATVKRDAIVAHAVDLAHQLVASTDHERQARVRIMQAQLAMTRKEWSKALRYIAGAEYHFGLLPEHSTGLVALMRLKALRQQPGNSLKEIFWDDPGSRELRDVYKAILRNPNDKARATWILVTGLGRP